MNLKNLIEQHNAKMFQNIRKEREDQERVSQSQNGSYANKELKAFFVGGKFDGKEMSHQELEKNGNGKFTLRFSALKTRNKDLLNLDLEDQPLVDGYLSPSLDSGKLRYDTQEAYDWLTR